MAELTRLQKSEKARGILLDAINHVFEAERLVREASVLVTAGDALEGGHLEEFADRLLQLGGALTTRRRDHV